MSDAPLLSPTQESIPNTALGLGIGGLIPFAVGAGYLLFGPIVGAQVILVALIAYGAVILSFLGAVHWGVALRDDNQFGLWLSVGVSPSLLGWGAVLLSLLGAHLLAFMLLILSFIAVYLVDRTAVMLGRVPVWYGRLRLRLTAVVVVTLGTAALAFV